MNSVKSPYEGISPDLWPRRVHAGEGFSPKALSQPADRKVSPDYMGDAIYLTRNLIGQSFTVGTTPVRLIISSYAWPYILMNPSTSVGLTTAVTGFSGTATNGYTSPSVGVAGFDQLHLALNVTAIGGANTWDIYQQVYDSVSATWVDAQAVFSGVSATGSYYAFPNSFGLGTDTRFRFDRTAGAADLTCSLGMTLKNGVGGSLAGLAQSVYIGGPEVTTTSGFPLLEGQRQTFIVGEGVELWAVAQTTVNIRVFQL